MKAKASVMFHGFVQREGAILNIFMQTGKDILAHEDNKEYVRVFLVLFREGIDNFHVKFPARFVLDHESIVDCDEELGKFLRSKGKTW